MTTDFFNAVIFATAKAIAAQYTAGDTKAASNRLEQHLGELDAAAGAAFIAIVQQFIETTEAVDAA